MTIGENIKRLRNRKGLKAIELANKLGISKTFMCNYEKDVRKPSENRLQEIADILGYPIEAFENTNCSENTIMHRLFNMFQRYDGILETDESLKEKVSNGTLEDGVYISFKELSEFMQDWYKSYNDMKNGIITKEQFQEWMDKYEVR